MNGERSRTDPDRSVSWNVLQKNHQLSRLCQQLCTKHLDTNNPKMKLDAQVIKT